MMRPATPPSSVIEIFDRMEQRAAVFGMTIALRAHTPDVRAEAGAAAAGHHEMDPVPDVMVERQPVRAADEPDVMPCNDRHELVLSPLEAPVGVWRITAVEKGWLVHQHDPVRFLGGGQPLRQKR